MSSNTGYANPNNLNQSGLSYWRSQTPTSPLPAYSALKPTGIYSKSAVDYFSVNHGEELPTPGETRPGYVIDVISRRWRKRQLIDDLSDEDMAKFNERKVARYYQKLREEQRETCDSDSSPIDTESERKNKRAFFCLPGSALRGKAIEHIRKKMLKDDQSRKRRRAIMKMRFEQLEKIRKLRSDTGVSGGSKEEIKEWEKEHRSGNNPKFGCEV